MLRARHAGSRAEIGRAHGRSSDLPARPARGRRRRPRRLRDSQLDYRGSRRPGGTGEGITSTTAPGFGAEPRLKTMQVARLHGFGSGEKCFAQDTRAAGQRELAGIRIDIDEADAFRRVEGNARVAGERADHEVGPDWERGLRAREADRLVVVEAHPDDGEEFG